MTQMIKRVSAIVLALGLAWPAASALAEDDALEVHGQVTAGAQSVSVSGDRGKFEETRAIPDEDAFVEDLRIFGTKGNDHFSVQGTDLSQDDQSLLVEGGHYGKYSLRFNWDEIMHHYSDNGRFLGKQGSGDHWLISDTIRGVLAPEFDFESPPPTATGKSDLLDLLKRAPGVDLKLQRKRGSLDLIYTPFENFNIRAGYLHEDRKGQRSMSSGAHDESPTGALPGSNGGSAFLAPGLEFPEPIDYDTDEVRLGFDYRRDNWHVDFQYQFTNFKNNSGQVTWDNPLQFKDSTTIGASPINRVDLSPDSQTHLLSLTGGISDLPLDTTLTGTVSWSQITQDDRFLGYTINPLLTVVSTTPANGSLAKSLALPANDLNGKVQTTLFNFVIDSRPIDGLSVTVKFNYYDYNNKSDEISWTNGWAVNGESEWSETDFEGLHNRVPEYSRMRVPVNVDYRVNHMLTLRADYQYQKYDRNEFRNSDTEENTYGGGLTLRPMNSTWFRLSYHRSNRIIDGSYANDIGKGSASKASFEWDRLRMADQAERDRDLVDAKLTYDPTDTLSIDFGLQYKNDSYDKKYYGIQDNTGYTGGIDVSYMLSDQVTISGYYSRDDYETEMLNRSTTDINGNGFFAIPENDWKTKLNDMTDTVGVAATVALIPDKLTLNLSADYSKAVSEFNTSNPNFLAGATTASATGFNWPDVESETTKLKLDLDYAWTENLSSGLHYLYEDWDLTDFATDNVLPYGIAPDTQGNSLDYFIFMDSNFSDYRAHIVSATLTYKF